MSTVAFTSDGIKVSSTDTGVTLSKAGVGWGDPWPPQDQVLRVEDIGSLIQALQMVLNEKRNEW